MSAGWLAPWNLAWLALIPVLVALYLMRMRRQDRLVPALFLWRSLTRESHSQTSFRRLRNNLLLWLQILILLLLALALSRPFRTSPLRVSPQMALVLDASASMQARHPQGGTRFEYACQQVRRLLRSCPANTEVLLAVQEDRPRVVVPFTTDLALVERQLARLRCSALEGRDETLQPFALSIQRSNPKVRLLFFADHPASRLESQDCSGQPPARRNLAIGSFQVFLQPEGPPRAFLVVQSFAEAGEAVTVSLTDQDGRPLSRQSFPLQARGRRALTIDLPPPGPDLSGYRATLEGEDDLSVDNQAWCALPRSDERSVTLVGAVDPFLERAVRAQEGVRVRRVANPGQLPAVHDVVVWAEPPAQLPAGAHILQEPPEAWRQPLIQVAGGKRFVPEPGSWAEGLGLEQLSCAALWPLKTTALQKLVATPEGQPLLGIVRTDGSESLVFCLDLGQTDLPLAPAFPMLIQRFLERTRGGQVDQVPPALRAGETLRLRSPTALRLTDPEGTVVELPSQSGWVTYRCTQPGFYRLNERRLAVNMESAAESDLSTRTPVAGAAGPPASAAPTGAGREELWRGLALLALLVLLAEWMIYFRPSRPW